MGNGEWKQKLKCESADECFWEDRRCDARCDCADCSDEKDCREFIDELCKSQGLNPDPII